MEEKTPQNEEYLDPQNFERQETIYDGDMFQIIKSVDKKNGHSYSIKSYKTKLEKYNIEMLNDLYQEIDIFSSLNYPSIIKYCGYSPNNFDKESRPMIFMDFASNKTLYTIFKMQDDKIVNNFLDDTKKLIIIYGIASSMSYLHSNNIVHRNLWPGNVFLDKNLYPKLFGFEYSKKLSSNNEQIRKFKLKGALQYLAPETLSNLTYLKSSDVYSFALIVYQIITKENPYKKFTNIIDLLKTVILDKKSPEFNEPIESCYKKLIEQCWSENPNERPTFDSIVHQLKNNPEFITEKVNKEEFYNYVKLIDESSNSIEQGKHIQQIDDLIKSRKCVLDLDKYKLESKKNCLI